ncbi:ABC transporter ATP-binding protein [Brucella sp. RRSP16]|uniref:ABC transporter ATP-binding protein n=1 Tax=Brucella TaxID=234 RepID=UPI000DD8D130|nr:ABC transporter ATP-binding protein [Brucella intermedia]MBM7325806.1 ABC transporter ATP-binding protein [Agrobacterium sp. S2]
MAFIDIRNINKFYGNMQALHDISLSIAKGSFVTLLGPSGSGKTTLLKILAGFEDVSSGDIRLEGRDITSLKPEKRNFGLVFQGYALFPHMSVFDNIAYPLKVRRRSREQISNQVNALLDLVQLTKFARRRPHELSGGQQQRVALARALVFEPDLLLLDEPMSALDKKLRIDLQDQLRDIHHRLGTTFINVTHDQEEAMHMSDGIAVMNHGRIEQYDTGHHLYRKPGSRFVADFIGKSNIFEGSVIQTSTGPQFNVTEFTIAATDLESAHDRIGRAELVVRPEDIRLASTAGAAKTIGDIVLSGVVATSTYSGDRVLYTVSLPNGRTIAAYGSARDGALSSDTPVQIAFDARDCILLN